MYDVHKLELARLRRGLTKIALARKAKVAEATVRRLLREGSAHPDSVKSVAGALGFRLSDVVIDTAKRPAPKKRVRR